MRRIFAALTLSCLFATTSQAAVNYDGCYQLYMPGSMYPSFCLDGTQEEGIGGAGARLVIFDTNSDSISACAVSSSLGGPVNTLEFILGDRKELTMSDVKLVQSRLEGTATFGKTSLRFIQINTALSIRLLSKLFAEPKCKLLKAGEIIELR